MLDVLKVAKHFESRAASPARQKGVSEMSIEQMVYIGLGVWLSLMVALEIAFRRSFKRTARFVERYDHRKLLSQAVCAGEGSLIFHAMQCTNCGGFHAEDDSECRERGTPEGKDRT